MREPMNKESRTRKLRLLSLNKINKSAGAGEYSSEVIADIIISVRTTFADCKFIEGFFHTNKKRWFKWLRNKTQEEKPDMIDNIKRDVEIIYCALEEHRVEGGFKNYKYTYVDMKNGLRYIARNPGCTTASGNPFNATEKEWAEIMLAFSPNSPGQKCLSNDE